MIRILKGATKHIFGIGAMIAFAVSGNAQTAAFNLDKGDMKAELSAAASVQAPHAHLVLACAGCGIDSDVYLRVFKYGNVCGHEINDRRAQEVARLAAQRKIDVDLFLRVFNRSCSYNSAIEVACQNR